MKPNGALKIAVLILAGLMAAGSRAGAVGRADVRDLGIAVDSAECRGIVACRTADGRNLVISSSLDLGARGWLLITDIDSGESRQVFFPEEVPNSPAYASLLSRNGRFYTGAGKVFCEFDPAAGAWLFHGIPQAETECFVGEAMADGPDGLVYAGTYPTSHLVSFDPKTKATRDLGRLDPEEKYFSYLVVDADGWAYAGLGTARFNIVAFHTKTGERRQLVPEAERALGTAEVFRGTDGRTYGQAGARFYRLSEGRANIIAESQAPPRAETGVIGWGRRTAAFADGRKVAAYDLPEKLLDLEIPGKGGAAGTKRRIPLVYKSGGSQITSLVVGPDGRVYGSSAHPMHFFAFDPGRDKLEDWGPVPRVGGGNFCAMATQGRYIAAAAYSGGFLYLYDSAKPWNGERGDDPNPKLVAQYKDDITRPRAALAYPDGRHVLMAGYMDYGRRGGGIAIYNIETGKARLLVHDEVVPDQSTIALKVLPDGRLVGGTSISTPGGGHEKAKEGELYIMDWETKKVVFRTVPVPGAADVASLEIGADGFVYGVSGPVPELFVFDPQSRTVIKRESLARFGGLPRQVLARAADGTLYGLMSKAVFRIDARSKSVVPAAELPVEATAGAVIAAGRLYFAAGSRLFSLGL